MKTAISVAILGVAAAINIVAIGALHLAMVDGVERAQLSLAEPERIIVSATRHTPELATSACPGPKAL